MYYFYCLFLQKKMQFHSYYSQLACFLQLCVIDLDWTRLDLAMAVGKL